MSGNITSQTQGFSALVTAQVAVVQAAAQPTAALDFSTGSILRALAEGTAWIGLWLQGLILQLLTVTRASTSRGSDLDTWMADFGVTRIAAEFAEGVEVFGRYTSASAASIPLGTQISSSDGTQIFSVVADSTQPSFDAVSSAYIIPLGVAEATVTVRNLAAGPAGNVAVGLVSVLSTPISGVDYVTNHTAMSGGTAAESDSALRSRFQTFINTRAQATSAAIGYTVSSTAGVVSYTITENYDYSGVYDPGSFYVVVDDGSGNPPGALVSTVASNVKAVTGCGIRFAVFGAVTEVAAIYMSITTLAGYAYASVSPLVQSAVMSYVNSLPVGAPLSYAATSASAVGVAGVASVSALTINGGVLDLQATGQQVIRTSSVVLV